MKFKLYLKKHGHQINLTAEETYNVYLMLLSKFQPEQTIKQEISESAYALVGRDEE